MNRPPLVAPELPNTVPILVKTAMRLNDEDDIRECIETAKNTYNRVRRPDGYRYWLEFLRVMRDESHLRKVVRGIIRVLGTSDILWTYVGYPEFSYEIAGIILEELDEDEIHQLRVTEKAYRGHTTDDSISEGGWNLNLASSRLTVLLNPDV